MSASAPTLVSMGSFAERRAVLTAALGFMGFSWRQPVPPVVLTLARWMNSWAGLGAVVTGMSAQGFNLELKEFPRGWRANFSPAGIAHSVVFGSAYEPAPWTAVHKAAWEALRREGRERPSAHGVLPPAEWGTNG